GAYIVNECLLDVKAQPKSPKPKAQSPKPKSLSGGFDQAYSPFAMATPIHLSALTAGPFLS
ncbi:hypothetical protein ACF8R6_17760, partial [Pseudomonas sp. CJQ_7]|uniref:hypothetical protein n=1 Tax=unclassified Pseudomonas TaxID=196821 RepID=UPI00370A3B32